MLIAAGAACGGTVEAPHTCDGYTTTLPVIELRTDGRVLDVEVARTTEERATGLSNRPCMPPDAGMLFDLETARIPGFWMKDTLIPLDFVWIGEDKHVSGITHDAQPEPGVADAALHRYLSEVPVRYVLELNAGAGRRLALAEGDVLAFQIPD